ncbi:MBL fold metallo-hydrolase [Micromonospora sp. CPCC 205561]|uniref:MBL fold metallo-hydrolase n=1 Tax=Micromonospora sp. CPCC 205561 TaxID=3122407 RepID=UPI002FEFC4B3
MSPASLTFLGHQSWLVEIGDTRVLVDPVLTDSFGHSDRLRFEIYPARQVAVEKMPSLDAVLVTNEHLDHFHLNSLDLLPPETRILMPRMMPKVCVRALEDAGRQVELVELGAVRRIGAVDVVFVPGGPDAPMWENRVASVFVRHAEEKVGGVFIQSDTSIAVPSLEGGCDPDIVVATHNGQVPPAGHLGAFDNMLPVGSADFAEVTGLRLLHGVLSDVVANFPSVRYVTFSGGGYVQVPAKHGEFLWGDFEQLAGIASRLSLTTRVLGMSPGQTVVVGDGAEVRYCQAEWIDPAEPSRPVAPSDKEAVAEPDLSEPLLPLFDEQLTGEDRALVESELQLMAPLLMQANLGRHLITQNTYLDKPVGPHRFAVHMRGFDAAGEADDGSRTFVLNFNNGRFEEQPLDLRDCLFSVPSGIDVNAVDLVAVLRGRIHIWELAVSRMRQWYLCDKFDSPVGFLYGYYSEQVRPELAAELYRNVRALAWR